MFVIAANVHRLERRFEPPNAFSGCGPATTHLVYAVPPRQSRAMASVQLKSVDHLTSAERTGLAKASRTVRPNAKLRRQFAELRQARSELCRSRADSKKAVNGLGVR